MKIKQAENLALNLSTLLETKGVVGFKIAYNLRKINDELKEYYQFKSELFKKYGEEKDGQLMINKESENFPSFLKELKPLEEQEIDLALKKINEAELIESGLSASQMASIWEIAEC